MHIFAEMSKAKKVDKRLTVNLTDDSFRKLKELSVEQDRSLSWMVNHAIDLYLKAEEKKLEGGLGQQP